MTEQREQQRIVCSAPAKLNLFLQITGQRQDGYHELQTLFRLLDYSDTLTFELDPGGEISRVNDIPGVSSEQDLVVKAARLLQQTTLVAQGVKIFLDKRLPMGGGLGGGSSDAASTLLALNQLWRCGLDVDALASLGQRLGADVPVFVRGQSAWGEGVGEKLTPVVLPSCWYLVVHPAVHVVTAELFSDSELTRDCSPITIRDFLAEGGENVFQSLVRTRYPAIDRAFQWLGRFAEAKLTGTGSCLFAEFADEDQARMVLNTLPDELEGFVAQGLNDSPVLSELNINYWAVAKR